MPVFQRPNLTPKTKPNGRFSTAVWFRFGVQLNSRVPQMDGVDYKSVSVSAEGCVEHQERNQTVISKWLFGFVFGVQLDHSGRLNR